MSHTVTFVFVVTGVVAVYLCAEMLYALMAFPKATEVIKASAPFSRAGEGERLLVVGDSTGYGTGATHPEESVAGRLGTLYPEASIENESVNGMKTAELATLLAAQPKGMTHSLIVLQIGGNDILFFTPLRDVERDIRVAYRAARERSERVVHLSAGNVGAAPAFGPALSALYHARTLRFREMFMRAAREEGVTYVDLYLPPPLDPFRADPRRYHSADGLHPSSDGYGVWFEKLKDMLGNAR